MTKESISCINWNDMPAKKVREGVEIKVFSGERITIQLAHLQPGHDCSLHNHPQHEQICYVISGKMDLVFGEEKYHLIEGSCALIPPGVMHDGILVGEEDVLVMDIWSPKRSDLV